MSKNQLQQTAELLLSNLGIKKGSIVLDFGCGNGIYSIAAAHLAGLQGTVIAVDDSEEKVEELKQKAKDQGLRNIHNYNGLSAIPQSVTDTVNIVLAFDVLHFLDKNKRNKVYDRFHRYLSSNGLLVIHPKHTKDNHPMWHFSTISIDDLIQEIENSHFQFLQQKTVSLLHDGQAEQGSILLFKK
jgi:cyclopropane fatty-acyl-phospholipid synthase-like methyltransferase